jgi:integrase
MWAHRGSYVAHMLRKRWDSMAGRRGFGRLRKGRSGRWQAGYAGLDGRVHYAATTFETADDARIWLRLEQRQIEADPEGWIPPKDRLALKDANRPPLFADQAERYITGKPRPRPLKPTTEANYRYLLERHILPVLGGWRIDHISPAAVQQWYESLSPRRPTERAHAYALLRSVMQFAVDPPLALIPENPCQTPSAGRVVAKGKIRTATLEELKIIVDNMPDRLRLAVLIAAWCGLRQGETMELRRQDVDVRRGTLTVSRAVTRVAGADPIVGDPKSEAGNRVVSIPPHILPAFTEHLKSHTGPERGALLFWGRDSGEQLAPSTLYRWYYPAREAAGRRDLRWHDLRHTSATMAAETGASLRDLMHRHGHSTAAASLRYQHYVQNRDGELAAKLSAMALRGN